MPIWQEVHTPGHHPQTPLELAKSRPNSQLLKRWVNFYHDISKRVSQEDQSRIQSILNKFTSGLLWQNSDCEGPSVSRHIWFWYNVSTATLRPLHNSLRAAAALQPHPPPICWGKKSGRRKKMSSHLSGGRGFLIKWNIFFFHCPWLRSPSLPVSCK